MTTNKCPFNLNDTHHLTQRENKYAYRFECQCPPGTPKRIINLCDCRIPTFERIKTDYFIRCLNCGIATENFPKVCPDGCTCDTDHPTTPEDLPMTTPQCELDDKHHLQPVERKYGYRANCKCPTPQPQTQIINLCDCNLPARQRLDMNFFARCLVCNTAFENLPTLAHIDRINRERIAND